jgi:hypothetical protein
MSMTRFLAVLPLLGLLALYGCGSGSTNYAEGGVSGTGITAGTTNSFGSIIVNGTRHVTDTATFTRDGDSAPISDFRVGEVVLVEWELDDDGVTRNARNVTYESEIKGPVTLEAVAGSKTVEVLGQSVTFDGLTVFIDNTGSIPPKLDPSELVTDEFVEVSGFRRADGSVQATLIELEDTSGAAVELNGFVTDSDPGPGTFEVNGLSVNTGGAVIIPNGFPEIGDFVRVQGEFAGGEVDADTVKIRPAAVAGKKGTKTEIEGLVTDVRANSDPAAADFDVSSLRVITDSQTRYGGSDVADITEDAHVEIEGIFNDDGSLLAGQINVLPSAEEISLKLEADVVGVDPGESSFTLRYGNRLIEVVTNALTQFEDESDEDDAEFNFGELRQFQHVEARGYLDGSVVTATRIERKDTAPATKRKLQGPVTNIEGAPGLELLTILGVGVDTSTVTDFVPAGRANFFNALDIDDVVSVGGQDTGSSVDWDELELEN